MFATLRKVLLVLLGAPFLLLGGKLVLDASQTTLTYWSAASWETVEGRLTQVERIHDPDWGDRMDIRYTYAYGGQTRESSTICPSPDCPEPEIFNVLNATLADARPLPVLVNPRRPDQALLFRHLHLPFLLLRFSSGLFCLFTGGSATAFGLLMLRRHIREQGVA